VPLVNSFLCLFILWFYVFKRKKERSLGEQRFVEFFDINFIDGANIYRAPKLGKRLEHM
jgi:hypothetical protein